MNCHCEHSDCHPNGDCRSAAVVVIETYGMRQQVCDTCRRVNPASRVVRVIEPEWTDAEVQTPAAGRRYFACVNTVTGYYDEPIDQQANGLFVAEDNLTEELDPCDSCADCERSYGPGRCPTYCDCDCHDSADDTRGRF